MTTALHEQEIIREVRLGALQPGEGAAYLKFDQPASHYALTGICAVVKLNGEVIEKAWRIGGNSKQGVGLQKEVGDFDFRYIRLKEKR